VRRSMSWSTEGESQLVRNPLDMRPPIGWGFICDGNGPLNEAPMLAARGAILLAPVATRVTRRHLEAQAGPTARLALDVALGKPAVGVDQRHTSDVGPFCERAMVLAPDAPATEESCI
jgi:hypothetical protein